MEKASLPPQDKMPDFQTFSVRREDRQVAADASSVR
jgi:hypothetical protein